MAGYSPLSQVQWYSQPADIYQSFNSEVVDGTENQASTTPSWFAVKGAEDVMFGKKVGRKRVMCRVNARLGTLLYVSVLVFLSKIGIFVKTIYKPIQLWKIITMKLLSWRFWRLQWSKASQHQPLIMKRGGSCKTYLNE